MIKKDKFIQLLGWAALAFSATAFFLPLMNPDIFWHLSAGKYAAAHLSPPRADMLSWPLQGGEWVDFEWGSQLLFYLAYKAGGFKALLLLKGLLLCLVLLVFRGLARLYGKEALLPAALPLLAASLVGSGDLRPENFTLLFFAIELYWLEKLRLKGIPRGWPLLLKAFLFFGLWVNLDPGCFYGLAIAGLYAAGELLAERLAHPHGGAQAGPVRSREYFKLLLAGLAATLANPYGWKIYGAAVHGLLVPVPGEYLRAWGASGLGNPYQCLYLLMLLGVGGSLVLFQARRRHAVYPHLACLVFLAWASAGQPARIPLFAIAGLAFAVALPWRALPDPRDARAGAAGWLILTLWFYGSFIWPLYTGSASFFRASSGNLAKFLKLNKGELSGLRLYNYRDWGGWLGWELAPEYKVFLDGRYLFRDKAAELAQAQTKVGNWGGLIEKYKFDLMLITLTEPLVPVKQTLKGGKAELFLRPAYLFYLPKKDWAVIYWDYKVAALVRRSAVPAAWLAAREYFYLRPADVPNLARPILSGDIPLSGLDRELALFLAAHPGGRTASSNTALVNFCESIKAACAQKGARCLL